MGTVREPGCRRWLWTGAGLCVLLGSGLLFWYLRHQAARVPAPAAAPRTLPAPAVRVHPVTPVATRRLLTAPGARPPAAHVSYVHTSGAFALQHPADWEVADSEVAALFSAPDEQILLFVTWWVERAVQQADLARLAEERTIDLWGAQPRFALQRQEAQAAGVWLSIFTYYRDGQQPLIGLAFYEVLDGVLFNQTLAVAVAEYEANYASLSRIINSFQFDAGAARLAHAQASGLP